ncbi:MAG: diguanylate cyclase [Rhizobiales bacterium]|nr:diguanylate cyclase [Hyphomicrobiales bacterium]
MSQRTDIAAAKNWSERALKLIDEQGLPPEPDVYAVWYAYATGQKADLNKEIDQRLSSGSPIDAHTASDLRRRYVAEKDLSELALESGSRLSSEVDKILKLVEATSGDNSEFGNSVREASQGLTSQSTPNEVHSAVEAIVEATRSMEMRSQLLEKRLQQTKAEITELRDNLDQARSEARTDGLTGVANRKAFDEVISREIKRAEKEDGSLALLIGDIDFFKKFNDTYGHRTGDQVLRLVASCLKGGARENDTVARYGGEEFAVIMPDITAEAAENIANEIRETVMGRELVKRSTGETLGRVTMSIGVGIFRRGDAPSALIERADACLYAAKDGGRNQVISEANPPEDLRKLAG